jgi:hypothetical protein
MADRPMARDARVGATSRLLMPKKPRVEKWIVDFQVQKYGEVWYVEGWTRKAARFLKRRFPQLAHIQRVLEANVEVSRHDGKRLLADLKRRRFVVHEIVGRYRDPASGESRRLN